MRYGESDLPTRRHAQESRPICRGRSMPADQPVVSAELAISETPAPPLHVINLTKRYGEERAIDRVTFAAGSGEILGIIGPNGAGKTTLLEAVVGLLPADSGEVLWHGEPLPSSQRRNALFYLLDGVRPYRDESTSHVVSFFFAVCQ